MANTIIHHLDFYSPWPLFGTKLSHQWGESRANFESLTPIVQGAVVDADANLIKAGDLAGWEFGEEDFHNKFRVFWNKGPSQFQFQCNDGSEVAPLWSTAFYVDCVNEDIQFNFDGFFTKDLHVAGGFYQAGAGATSTITVTDTTAAQTFQATKITFSRDGFYITGDTSGNPIINLDGSIGSGGGSGEINTASSLGGISLVGTKAGVDLPFKGLTAGPNITLTPSGTAITIEAAASSGGGGSGFYGSVVKQVDVTGVNPEVTFSGVKVFSFNHQNFYITQNDPNTDEVLVNWRDLSPATGDPTVKTGVISRDFTGVEWQFTHNFNETDLLWAAYDSIKEAIIPDKVDTSDPNLTYFYFTNSITGTAVLSTGRVSTTVTFAETEPGGGTFEDDTFKFDSAFFYISGSGTSGQPIVSLISGGGVTAHGALTGLLVANDHPQYRDATLPYTDSLDMGSNRIINVAAPVAGTDAARLTDIGPGFYGIIFRGTDPGVGTHRSDDFKFHSDFFYIQGTPSAPIVSLQDDIVVGSIEAGSNVVTVRNTTGLTIAKHKIVALTGNITGKTPEVQLADATDSTKVPTIGITLAAIPDNNFGTIIISGSLDKVNLTNIGLAGASVGNRVFTSISTPGDLQTATVLHPNFSQVVGVVTDDNNNNGSIYVTPQSIRDLNDGTFFNTFTIGLTTATSVVLAKTSTAARTATFQDASGTVAYTSDIGPGFYGVIFQETQVGGTSFKDDTINFDSNFFYLTSGGDGKPIVSVRNEFDEKSITIPYPSRNDEAFWWVPAKGIEVKSVYHVLRAHDSGFYPSVDWTIRFGPNPHGIGTELVTGGSLTSFYPGAPVGDPSPIITFSNATIPAGNQVWVETKDLGEGGGIEEQFHITLQYTLEDV